MDILSTNLLEVLETALPVSIRHVLHRLRDVGRQLDMRTALVGGVPRDLLRVREGQLDIDQLYGEVRDFDIVVEGDAIIFAKELSRRLPGQLTQNEEFHTATLTTHDPVVLDIASARTEEYESPGSLPTVSTVSVDLAQDLPRRDFSINAMAIDVSNEPGLLIDPVGGAGDVRDSVVRILHPESFIDDPTRLMRSLRYSLRLNYDMEDVTRAHFSDAVEEHATDYVSSERIRYELECIGNEERWAEIWAVMDLSRLTRSIYRGLAGITKDWEIEDANAFDVGLNYQRQLLDDEELEPWLVRTAWVLKLVRDDRIAQVAERLGLFTRHIRFIESAREVLKFALPKLPIARRPSEIAKALETYPRQAVVLAIFLFQPRTENGVVARKYMMRYVTEFSAVRSELNGDDLLKLGFTPGPLLGKVRDELRYGRMDETIKDLEMEREYALGFITPVAPEAGNEQENNGSDVD